MPLYAGSTVTPSQHIPVKLERKVKKLIHNRSDRPDITPETRPPPGVVPGQLPQAYYGGGAPFYPPQQASGPPPQASGGVVAPPQQQSEQQNHVYK